MFDNVPLIEALERHETTMQEIANQTGKSVEETVFDIANTLWYLGECDKAIPLLEEQLAREGSIKLQFALLRCLFSCADEDKPRLYKNVQNLQSLLRPKTDVKTKHPDLGPGDRDRVLRVGFACTYSNLKPLELSILPLLRAMNRSRFQLYFFSIGVAGYPEFDQLCDEHVVLLDTDTDVVCREIEARQIDILFDLDGLLREDYPIDVFARQPARIQAGWWNTPLGSGIDTIQYHFYDGQILMPEDYQYYAEKIITIPGTANLCYAFTKDYPLTPSPCTKTDLFIFGSFTALFKHNDAVLQTWMEILRRTPNSVLFIKAHGARSPRFMQRLARIAEEYGIDQHRIMTEDVSIFDTMMTKYAAVDLALGTFSYGPGTTSLNALWQGIPTLIYKGTLAHSRWVSSIMLDAGMGEFIREDRQDYIDEAVRLAQNPQRLIDLRQTLRPHLMETSTYFNPQKFARNFEQACVTAWHDWYDKNAKHAASA